MVRPAVLLLHAFPLDARMWDGTRQALERAGFSVEAPELPLSGPPPEGALIPVGVSMGGYAAFDLWRGARDRIRALVLVDTRAGADSPEAREGRNELIELARSDGAAGVWERNGPKLFAPGAAAEAVERARRMALAQSPDRFVRTIETVRDRPDSQPLLAEIDVPVLVVHGEDDALIPMSEAEELAAKLPDARLVRLPGVGHLPPLERPDVFERELLAFLAAVT
jgi:3-oxoadipate enol-lactonase